jgi:Cep192 domain 4
MPSLIRRAAVAAGAAVMLLGPAAGVASAGTVMLSWSPTTSPGTYNFGTLSAGQTVSQAFTLTDSGNGSTSALAVTLTGSLAFTKTKDACTGVKLAPKKSCSVTVQYAPTASGETDSATLTATSSKPAATASLSLLGQTKASPALSTAPNPATGPVGTVLQDTAALTGGSSPTGSILFTLYATADCSGSVVDSEKLAVSGDGSYTTSTGYKTPAAGTYQWVAAYSGDANNNGASTKCGDEPVTVSPASPALSTAPAPATGPVGTVLQDTASLTGGFNPTGSIVFTLYPTADCSGSPVDTETVAVNGNGGYATSTGGKAVTAGTYQWTAAYSGDKNNDKIASPCGAEPVTISPLASPVLSTAPNPATGPVGTVLQDTAALTGGSSPTGSILFTLYATADCSGSVVDSEKLAVSGDGSYTTSTGYKTPAAGTYQWVAAYSGDANNNGASTKCGDEPVTVSPASPALSTAPAPATGPVGTVLQDTASLTGGFNPTGSIVFTLYPTADCSGSPVDTETVAVNGNGGYATSTGGKAVTAGTYQWTAAYSGDKNNDKIASPCGAEPVTISPLASPVLSTAPNPATGPVGTVLQDTASLTGGSSPTGSILFTLYATADCSGAPVDSEKVAVSGNGSYGTSTGYKTPAAGTYQWVAAYSGDANNSSVTTKCGDEPVAITIAPFLFWADQGSGQIWEANPDGTNAQPLINIPPQPGPAGVAVSGSNLYWANQGDGTIWEANLDGTNAQPLSAIPVQQSPVGVAVNGSNLFWADQGSGQIWEANPDGTNAQPLINIPPQPGPAGVAVSAGNLYWANQGDGTIWEANLDGTNAHSLSAIPFQDNPVGVAVNGSNLFWADQGSGQIWEANPDGTNAQPLINIPPQPGPAGVAVSGSNLYWANQGDGTIWEANLDGTNAHPLINIPLQPGPFGVAFGPQ